MIALIILSETNKEKTIKNHRS